MSINIDSDIITVGDKIFDIEENCTGNFPVHTEFEITDRSTGEKVEGITAVIGAEEHDSESPRDWSNVGVMACYHPNYSLGDKDYDPRDFLDNEEECDDCNGDDEQCSTCDGEGAIQIDITTWIREKYKARVVMPLFLYDHSGISMSSGQAVKLASQDKIDLDRRRRFMGDDAGWDTSSVGVIFDTPETVKECMGDDVSDDDIIKALQSEVAVYSQYLEGDVHYFSVDDEETNFSESCGGMYDDEQGRYIKTEVFEAIETALEKREAEIAEREDCAARDIVTV